jgi:MoaA/NifB/PqqE/SkfB family radical SAM enzyme
MNVDDFDLLVEQLKVRHISMVAVNGHGETTMLPDWHQRIMRLAEAGFGMRITTNFARLLRDEELEAMAHIKEIMVSIDTHRPELQRVIRRRVDIGNILINMNRVVATAEKLSLPSPNYIWNCVVSDKVALDLPDYVRFGLACGVRHFTLGNLTKYADIEGATNVQHVTTLPNKDLRRFLEVLAETREITTLAGAKLTIYSGLFDTVREELARREAA